MANYRIIVHLDETYAGLIGAETEIEYIADNFTSALKIGENNDYEPSYIMGYDIIDTNGEVVFATDAIGEIVKWNAEYVN